MRVVRHGRFDSGGTTPLERKWIAGGEFFSMSFDRVLASGYRVGGDLGIGGPFDAPAGYDFTPWAHVSLFGAWMRR